MGHRSIHEGGPGEWLRAIDTAEEPPILAARSGIPVAASEYRVQPHAVVVLIRDRAEAALLPVHTRPGARADRPFRNIVVTRPEAYRTPE